MLQLFVREHRSGCFTVEVVGAPELRVFTDDLKAAREELELVISDRVERTHPSLQSRFFTQPELTAEVFELEGGLLVEGEKEATPRAMEVTALVSTSRAWTSVWIPRLDLRIFVDAKQDWRVALSSVTARHLERLSADARLQARPERGERLDPLAVAAHPPPLAAFTGKNRFLDVLPAPAPREEEEEKKGPQKKATPALERVGVSLTRLAAEGELERAHGRDDEVADLLAMLRKQGNAVIAVVGATGVGKSTVLNEVVHRMPERPVWFADASRLIAGDGWAGDWQRQCLDVVEECEQVDVIWYIGSLLPLLDAGKHIGSDQNVSMLLKPMLSARRVTVVGECTEAEWSQLELRDVGFARCFTPYRIEEPSEANMQAILHATAAQLAKEEGVTTTPDGLMAVTEVCRRYVSQQSRLGSTVQFLRRAVERVVAEGSQRWLNRRAAVSAFSSETGLPELLVRDDIPLDPEAVRAHFYARVIGQQQAVDRIVDLIAVIKAGLSDLSKPLGSFLFVGPTGVGKTEMAKALAGFLFDSERRLVRFDMSEYVGADAIHRFLGDRESEGKLVEAIRRTPFAVVLLDEIEKGHPAVFDVLLQVLGEGRLTDEAGRVASFANAVIVMTSNLGVETFKDRVGFERADLAEAFTGHFLAEAERFFRPELFNRIDHVVPFLPLGAEQIERITAREIAKFTKREGIRQRNLVMQIEPEVHRWLAERGVDPRYGARPLKREVERSLAVPMARRLSKTRTARQVRVSVAGDELSIEVGGEGRASGKGARSAAAIEGADLLLFRERCFRRSGEFRELEQGVRLLEQLSSSKRFWENRALADERTRSLAADRELLDDFARHRERLESLSDLAYDAFFSGDAGAAKTLEEEVEAHRAAAEALELRLFARRFHDPDAAVLYFDPASDADDFLGRLLLAYLQVARKRLWKAVVHVAQPEGRSDEVKPKKAELHQRQWRWTRVLEVEPDDELGEARLAVTRREPGELLAVTFTGDHAGAIFSSEVGLHAEVSVEGIRRARISYQNGAGKLLHPAELSTTNERRRTFNRQRWIAEDHALAHQRTLTTSLGDIVDRFLSQVPALRLLGPRDRSWYDAVGF